MKVLTLFLVFFTSSGFSNSFNLSKYQATPANIFHICQTIFRHNPLQTSDCFELVLSRDDTGYNLWFSLSLSACFNLEAGLRTEDNGLQDVSLFAEENGSENMKELEEELMMHRFIQDTNTNKLFKNKITTEERSDEELSLKTVSEKSSSKQMIQNRVTLTSNIEDVLEENQEHLGRSEEDSASISSQKATKAEKYYLSDTEGNYTQKFNKNTPTAKMVHFTPKPSTVLLSGKPTIVTQMENNTIFMVRHNKVSPPQPQGTKPSPRLKRLSTTAPSMSPTKTSRIFQNKKPSKEKKRRNDNKTWKPQEGKNKIPPPTLFPYFMDDYCPPVCACYGRVVQCSDKGVEQFPYGIPYNARYILLMNNHINSIQLDLLNEYSSMEFLSLSNNRLTDGAIEGSFEGVPVLKRLYLDRNQLQSVPTDLPVSLEELRLDNNLLETMSEAAWAQCPSLLVLSLSNNSLGNRSGSLPPGALSPLHNLCTLNLDYNQLASVPLELPLSIKELYLRGNHLEQLSRGVFNGISQMLVLDLSANRLKSKGLLRDSLLNATHLESLNLEGNKLKQVPQSLPNSLKTLNLEGNLISSVKKASFLNLNNLEHLGLARNTIFKVSTGAFKTLPALHQLDLCHNKLHQVPRQLPEGLHSVALAHNKIESVPSNAFCWGSQSFSLSRLVQVRLEHNFIDMGKLDVRAFRCLRGMQVVHFY
uniref:Wu:fc23c09 n=1 Tax=Xiphophorus couchianus TaxID=32473 RepID=A0A3B5M427_9TELE